MRITVVLGGGVPGCRVGVMREGRIEQLAPPTDVYSRPATAFVAEFVGLTNRLAGTVSGSTVQVRGRDLTLVDLSTAAGPPRPTGPSRSSKASRTSSAMTSAWPPRDPRTRGAIRRRVRCPPMPVPRWRPRRRSVAPGRVG
ncbi:MAG TPA: hypothetical protein VGA04_00360 [Streptosporangiaceae bacterium]